MTQQDSRELKSCPFCSEPGYITPMFKAKCSNEYQCSLARDNFEMSQTEWNTRAQSADTALLQQVREKLKEPPVSFGEFRAMARRIVRQSDSREELVDKISRLLCEISNSNLALTLINERLATPPTDRKDG